MKITIMQWLKSNIDNYPINDIVDICAKELECKPESVKRKLKEYKYHRYHNIKMPSGCIINTKNKPL